MLVLSLYKENYLHFVCPFDYTALAVSGKVGYLLTGLTTPVGWLLLLQLTVLSRSAIAVLVAFLYCPLFFEFSVAIGVSVIGLSQISFFLSSNYLNFE